MCATLVPRPFLGGRLRDKIIYKDSKLWIQAAFDCDPALARTAHRLQARRIIGDDFKLANLFRQLTSALPDARLDSGGYTLIVAGHTFATGPGVIAMVGAGALGGESLLDARCESAALLLRPCRTARPWRL